MTAARAIRYPSSAYYVALGQSLLFSALLGFAVAGPLGIPVAALALALGRRLQFPRVEPATPNTRAVALVVALAIAGVAATGRSPALALLLGFASLTLGHRLSHATVNRASVQIGLLVVVGLVDGGAPGSMIRSIEPNSEALGLAGLVFVAYQFMEAFLPIAYPAEHLVEPHPPTPAGQPVEVVEPPVATSLLPLVLVAGLAACAVAGLLTSSSPTLDRSAFEIQFGLGDGLRSPRRDHPGLDGVLDASDNPTLSDEVVLRVRSDIPMYWRGMTYNAYDGRYWYDTLDRIGFTFPGGGTIMNSAAAPAGSVEMVQNFTLGDTGLDVLLTTPRADTVYFEGFEGTYSLLDEVIVPDQRLAAGASWTVISSVPIVSADDLRASDASGATTPPVIGTVYAVEDTVSAETAALALDITAAAPTVYDKVIALEEWFDDNVRYDRWDAEVPSDVDPVDHLLFTTRRGYCEQIASAMTVMLRSLGIPARIVVGYVPGEFDRSSGEWLSRGTDGHAWTEVYFPGVGWQAFDPTAGVPLTADALDAADPSGLGGVDLPATWPLIVAGVLVVVGTLVALRRRHRPVTPPETDRRVEALGARLELDWSTPGTLRDRLADLERAGVDAVAVAEAGRTIEHWLYAGTGTTASGTTACETTGRTRLDAALDHLEEAVEERRRALVTA